MRSEIERMEGERAAMISEVESQIERALASMAFSESESDIGTSASRSSSRRPSFRANSAAGSAFGDVRDESIAEEDEAENAEDSYTVPISPASKLEYP